MFYNEIVKANIDIIFVDIDWTILDHSLSPKVFDLESIDALKKAQAQGVKVFLCSARPYHSVSQIGLYDIFTPDGSILCNGGLIIDKNKTILFVLNVCHFCCM